MWAFQQEGKHTCRAPASRSAMWSVTAPRMALGRLSSCWLSIQPFIQVTSSHSRMHSQACVSVLVLQIWNLGLQRVKKFVPDHLAYSSGSVLRTCALVPLEVDRSMGVERKTSPYYILLHPLKSERQGALGAFGGVKSHGHDLGRYFYLWCKVRKVQEVTVESKQ